MTLSRRLAPPAVRALVATAALAGALVGVLLGGGSGSTGPAPVPPQAASVASTPAPSGPSPFAAAIPSVVARLDLARVRGRRRLADGRTAAAQAAGGTAVERAYLQALERLQPLASGDPRTARPILDGLGATAAAYGRLSDAARQGRRTAYRRATAAVGTDERRLRALLENVRR